MYRLQHCLEWVTRVYVSKLTPDSVVTYLFHDYERSLWLFCSVSRVRTLVCDDQSTVHTQLFVRPACNHVLRVRALFKGLTEFCFVFRFGFCATLPDFTSPIECLHFCYCYIDRCMKSFSAFLYSEYRGERPSTAVFVTPHVHSDDQLCALNRDCYSDC